MVILLTIPKEDVDGAYSIKIDHSEASYCEKKTENDDFNLIAPVSIF